MRFVLLVLAALVLLAACAQQPAGEKKYVSEDPEACQTIRFMCVNGMKPFSDSTGCGCEPDDQPDLERKYVSTDTGECTRILFQCEPGTRPFTDDTGCGCEKAEDKLKAFECEPSQRDADFCTMQYDPVCGWFDPEKVQCIRYPCAQTFGNSCVACQNEDIAYYTEGECPE